MIISEKGEELIVIRQTDHATLAGFLAREWGNENFSRPELFASFQIAASEHDNGWMEWEAAPQIDPATFLPYTFMSIPTLEHIALYQRGLERILKIDRYAALLVSLHITGLYDRTRATMPGFSAKYIRSSESYMVSDFVQRLRLQQLRLKVDLRSSESTKPFTEEKSLQANLQRLEALDRLSLYLCGDTSQPTVIDAVPASGAGTEMDLEITPKGNGVINMTPYLFRREPLSCSILARRIRKHRYAEDGELQRALAAARYFPIKFTIHSAAHNRESEGVKP